MNKKMVNRIVVIVVVISLAAAFMIFDLGQYLSLPYIRESQEKFQVLYSEHRAAVIAGYMTIYILVTSLSLPGAAVMTVAGPKMPLRTFYWVSQIGMLPGTIVYVNAGKELAEIESLSGILSPGLIISFALLGILPLASKKSIEFYKSRNVVKSSRG